jgi:hypothetical protein
LQELILDGNRLGDQGAQLLAEGLTVNTSLKTISVFDNQMTNNGKHILESKASENRKIYHSVVREVATLLIFTTSLLFLKTEKV